MNIFYSFLIFILLMLIIKQYLRTSVTYLTFVFLLKGFFRIQHMRKLLILPIALIVALLVVQASGAFTSVNASRDASVSVVSDTSALLALTPYNGPNGAYFVDSNNDGIYELRISNGTTGLNADATIVIDDIFTITNNGTRQITLTLQKTGAHTSNADFGTIEGGVTLGTGESYTVGIEIDTNGLSDGTSLLSSITLVAN